MPPRTANAGGQNPEFILREFQGMNVIEGREAINDNEFYWCENVIPVAPAAAYPVPAALATTIGIGAETTAPTYTMSFAVGVNQFSFTVFGASGNGYITGLTGGTVTAILTGLTSGFTYATPYNNQGILIIDPTGYWDYGVTTPNVLTPQNNTAANAILVGANTTVGGNNLEQIVTGTGTGATFQALYQVVNVNLNAAGLNYAVGDSVYLADGSPTVEAQIIVASVGAGGAITGITLAAGGSYPGPTSATLVATGPTGNVTTTTGNGTGATFTDHIRAFQMNILTRGTGYTGTTTVVDQTSTPQTVDTWNITSSGVIGGQGIATYQGRVWISFNRTVFFTDINSYFSFGNAGGSFFISDSYLVGNITVLYAANNYLYIFGASSIDALSNVTITNGVTSFSRINVTGSVGTSQPASVTAYYRAILFYHSSGIYLLAGATPEKISEKISQVITAHPSTGGGNVFGFVMQIQGEICAAMQLNVLDGFTQSPTVLRPLIVAYFRGKWWVHSFANPSPGIPTTAITSLPLGGVFVAFGWRANLTGAQLYEIFASVFVSSAWLIKTKLWDGGAPLHEKQSINAAIAGVWPSAAAAGGGITITVDTEFNSQAAVPITGTPTPGYNLEVTAANEGASQYLGMTINGAGGATTAALSQLRLLALRGKAERDMLQ